MSHSLQPLRLYGLSAVRFKLCSRVMILYISRGFIFLDKNSLTPLPDHISTSVIILPVFKISKGSEELCD